MTNVSISKVQRNMVGRTTASLGLIDLDNDAQITEIAASIRVLREMIEEHSAHEHEFFHPLIAAADPEIVVLLRRTARGKRAPI